MALVWVRPPSRNPSVRRLLSRSHLLETRQISKVVRRSAAVKQVRLQRD
jgi:hypothetical protein